MNFSILTYRRKSAIILLMVSKQNLFFGIIVMIFAVLLVLSNISASNTFYVNDFISLSAAEFLFPITYIISDLLAEFYGTKTTTRVVVFGLGLVLFSSVFLYLSTLIPSNYVEYNTVFGSISSGVVGITMASIIAFGIGTFTNSVVLTKMKKKDQTGTSARFFARAFTSSVIAEVVDSFVFITLCCTFAPEFYDWSKLLSFVFTISCIKLTVELILFPFLNLIRKKIIKRGLVFSNKIEK